MKDEATENSPVINDGGPAFPEVRSVNADDNDSPVNIDPDERYTYVRSFGGMSLRAHFAGQAMQGLIAHKGLDLGHANDFPEHTARLAARFADALIAELKRKP